jgi:hypothetical protein
MMLIDQQDPVITSDKRMNGDCWKGTEKERFTYRRGEVHINAELEPALLVIVVKPAHVANTLPIIHDGTPVDGKPIPCIVILVADQRSPVVGDN